MTSGWMCRYPLDIKYKGLMFNTSERMVTGCYVDSHFAVLWEHDNPQYIMCSNSRTGFVVYFSRFPLFLVSNI